VAGGTELEGQRRRRFEEVLFRGDRGANQLNGLGVVWFHGAGTPGESVGVLHCADSNMLAQAKLRAELGTLFFWMHKFLLFCVRDALFSIC
jgi:hypothetical protein